MTSTPTSRRTVFRHLAQKRFTDWPAYDATPLYDQHSLAALEEDIRTVATVWFSHEAHTSVDEFARHYPVAYHEFGPHDRYATSTSYEMSQLFRVFLLKALHGWDHETALLEYLDQQPDLCEELGFDTLPDQSTLWRSWNHRFTPDLQETVQTAARTILIKASQAGVSIPREPDTSHPLRDTDDEETGLDDQTVLDRAEDIAEQVSRIVYPAFSLDRGDGCEIHEHAYWDLQTYLGLRENLAVNEGARSFVHESDRERTPFGHAHRDHIRDLSIERIREMYQEAVSRLLDQAAETEQFHRMGTVAIDTTEADPFTGDRTGHEDEILGTKEGNDEYAYQWATVQLVGDAVPLVLDARPVRKGDSRKEIVEDLLDTADEHVYIDEVLMDREFDSQHVLEAVADRGLRYLVPKRMQTSEKAQAKRLLQRDEDRYVTDRKLHLGNNEWHQTTLIYSRKENSEHTDHRQYAVFMTNDHIDSIFEYSDRWDIERGYKSIKRFMAATTSKDFVLRFFYFAFACLLYSICGRSIYWSRSS